MKIMAATFSILFVFAAATVQAQPYERTADVPAIACKDLTLRQCMKLANDVGIADENCYQARWRDTRPDYTVGDCLKVREQLRGFMRRRLDGNLPPIPVETPGPSLKNFPKYVNADGTPVHQGELACVDDPHAGRVCIGLPSDQELDAPAFP